GGGGSGGGPTNQQTAAAQNKRATPCVRSRSELRRILHDKLEWNEKTAALDLTLLVCADESDPAEAELIVVSSGCVATTTRYVRSDIVEAQRRREKEERAREMTPEVVKLVDVEPEKPPRVEEKMLPNCEDCSTVPLSIPTPAIPSAPPGDELFRFDPSSKTHKCKVLNQIARSVQKAWCGLLFVPAYQLGQATSFIRALNPKPDSSHYVDGYISRLCCLEDLLWALRSARGLLNVEPPLAYSIWHSMREEDMAQLSEYSELTCTCVTATLHERAQSPPSLLNGSELWPSVVVPPRNCQPPRLPWPISPTEASPLDDLFNDES
ncbi:hypothetical protein PENTCL1PPCAC_2915, partial [Pristionchus entomophagus]